jgi:atypical dual specificity phosphatase
MNLPQVPDYYDPYGKLILGSTNRPSDCIDISMITSRIFLGSYDFCAKVMDGLKLYGITHLLTVGDKMPACHPDHFTYKIIDIPDRDSIDISKYFDECFQFINDSLQENKENKVLIHCFAGCSRSVTITAAYLMITNTMSFPEAFEIVRKSRHFVKPNRGFRSKLRGLAKKLGKYDLEQIKKYDQCLKYLLAMHEKKTIDIKTRDTVLNIYEDIFGLYHPHTLDVNLEMESFLSINSI